MGVVSDLLYIFKLTFRKVILNKKANRLTHVAGHINI